MLCLMDFLSIFPAFYMASVTKTMGMQKGGIDDEFLTWIGSIGSVANGLSRIIWGPIQDKTGFKAIYRVVLVIELLVCSLITFIVQTNRYLYMVWVFMGYMCLGAHFVLTPNCILAIFGMRSSVQMSAMGYTTRCLSAISGMVVSKALVDAYGDASFNIMFFTSCGFIIISGLLLTTVFDESPIRKEDVQNDGYVKPNRNSEEIQLERTEKARDEYTRIN